MECTSDGTVNVNPTIVTSVRHSSLHFDALKLASVCRIPYVFQLLCVCYRLSLTLDVVSLMSCTNKAYFGLMDV